MQTPPAELQIFGPATTYEGLSFEQLTNAVLKPDDRAVYLNLGLLDMGSDLMSWSLKSQVVQASLLGKKSVWS